MAQLWIGNTEVAALLCGYLRVQGSEHHTLPLRLRRGKDSGLFFFGGFFRLWLLLRQFTPVSVFLLIPVICMGNHLIEIEICQVAIQLRQTSAGNLMDGFSVHLIHQPESIKIGKDFHRMLTIGSRTERQINMAKVGEIRLLIEHLQTILVDKLLSFFQFGIGAILV